MSKPENSESIECRDVMDAIPVYVWSSQPDGTVDFVNPQWEQYTGLPPEAAFGWKWRSVIHPEDREGFTDAWRLALQSLEPLEAEFRVQRHDGAYRWWLIRCRPAFSSQGTVARWYCAGFDVDDRRHAQDELQRQELVMREEVERELRETIDSMPVLFGSLGSDGNVDFFNRRTLEYYGLQADEMIGFNWKNVVHPEDLPRLIAAHLESLPSGKPLDIETRCKRADGEYRWLIHRMVPRYNDRGEITKWYGTSFDIEDRKRAEEAVLEQRVLERTRIARELHDTLLQNFQAALLILGSATNLLDAGPAKERFEQALTLVDHALSEGREAIQGLRFGLENPEGLITSLSSFGQGLAAMRKVGEMTPLQTEVAGQVVPLKPATRHEVFGIGSEALRNAYAHSHATLIQLQFRYEAEEFRLSIADNGIGIDPTVLANGRGEGHFGLPGLRERAKIVNGRVALWSQPGEGTRIELVIPAAHAYLAP